MSTELVSPRVEPSSRTLLISEIFGPTVQGEGPSSGQEAVFLRLSRCNLTCSWCDTPYTWDWGRYDITAETAKQSPEMVLQRLLSVRPRLVIVTGGEPLLQTAALIPVLSGLAAAGVRVEIETNGTVAPTSELLAMIARVVVSPKLAHSGIPQERRLCPEVLRAWAATQQAVFKFVVSDPADGDEITAIQRAYELDPVWVMPEGTTASVVLDRMPWLAELALARGWHLSTRLHVLLWGDQRGR